MRNLSVGGALRDLALAFGYKPTENEEAAVQLDISRCHYNFRGPMLCADSANEESDPPSLKPPMPAPNPNWKWLSPTEEVILRILSASEWKKKEDVAKEAGVPCDRDLEAILRNMSERQMVESAPGRGWRLKLTS